MTLGGGDTPAPAGSAPQPPPYPHPYLHPHLTADDRGRATAYLVSVLVPALATVVGVVRAVA